MSQPGNTREVYVRAVVTVGTTEIILGLEFRPGDEYKPLRAAMRFRMRRVQAGYPLAEDDLLAELIESSVTERWPDRAYFIEVSSEPDEGWVQIFDPKGFVRRGG